jgi:catechol 2,3-dioxygenase-like lactoylglutathione lyase family enzyme
MYFQTLDGDPVTHKYTTGGAHNFRDGNSQIGDCQLEIYPMKPGPGMFISEYLEKKGPGINHIAFNTPDIERDTQLLIEKGCDLVFNASVNGKTIENYLDTRKFGDVMISLRPNASNWENTWKENNLNHPLVSNWKLLGLGIVVENVEKASDYYLELGFPLNPILKKYEFPNILSSQIGVGPIVFEFLEPTNKSSIYQNCYDNRGEGLADLIYLVDDLKVEIEKLTKKGVNLIDSNKDYAILETRKEGNILTRLIQS